MNIIVWCGSIGAKDLLQAYTKGRQAILPAPGVLDFDKKLIQFREKSTLGVKPVAVIHHKDVK